MLQMKRDRISIKCKNFSLVNYFLPFENMKNSFRLGFCLLFYLFEYFEEMKH